MTDFWCLLFGCGGSTARDIGRAAPEIDGNVLLLAAVLVVGFCAVWASKRI